MLSVIKYIKRVFKVVKYSDSGYYKMVIIVRSDLSMGTGKTAAQCAHAAVECYRQAVDNSKYQELYEPWLLQGQPKIVVTIRNEQKLLTLAEDARKVGLITAVIKDAGKTVLKPGTISVLGIGPGPKEVVDNLTGNLKLL
ncbi:peptidyl-tRNA hydrolase 2, mitochondrial [Nomia melanderi]|uniref:peptidyl-tRNA hydrolase 2, mitochondrial n=1 Tax=Nomia melanderi TaxID=2448451 RepID=UPI003FCEE54C